MKSPLLPLLFGLFCLCAQAQDYVPYKSAEGWQFMHRPTGAIHAETFEEAEYFRAGYALVKKEGLWGALDAELKVAIPLQYQKLEYLAGNILKASKGDQLRIYYPQADFANSYRDLALLKGYDSLLVTATAEGKYGLINLAGKTIIPHIYDTPPTEIIPGILKFARQEKTFFPWQKSKKIWYGALDIAGKEIVPFEYLFIDAYGSGLIKAQKEEQQHIYSPQGEKIEIPENARYHKRDLFTELHLGENIAVYADGDKKNLLFRRVYFADDHAIGEDLQGHLQIMDKRGKVYNSGPSYKYQYAKNRHIKVCIPNENGRCDKYGLIDLEGKTVLPPQFSAIHDWNTDYAICGNAESEGKSGVINLHSGDTVLDFSYRQIKLLNCNYFLAYLDQETHFYDPALNRIEPLAAEEIIPGTTRIAVDQLKLEEAERLYANQSGERVKFMTNCAQVPRQALEADAVALISDPYRKNSLPERLAVSFKGENYNHKYFLADREGVALSKARYTAIMYYMGDLIIVGGRDTVGGAVKSVSGAINFAGETVISNSYEDIVQVLPQAVIVKKYGVMGVLSRAEEVLIPLTYNSVAYHEASYYLLEKFSKWQIADGEGKILSAKYDEILQLYPEGIFKVRRGDQTFFIDDKGKEYITP